MSRHKSGLTEQAPYGVRVRKSFREGAKPSLAVFADFHC